MTKKPKKILDVCQAIAENTPKTRKKAPSKKVAPEHDGSEPLARIKPARNLKPARRSDGWFPEYFDVAADD